MLTDAPAVPPPIARKTPAHVLVDLDVIEVINEIADGVKYTQWTYGGQVPGKFIRVRQGDTITFTLRNLTSNLVPHNIDLHSVTGPGGGAKVTLTDCAACHDISPARRKIVGPPFYDLVGRKPASAGLKYEKWDRAALDEWLRDPTQIKPSTMMTYRVREDGRRAQIVDALESLKD